MPHAAGTAARTVNSQAARLVCVDMDALLKGGDACAKAARAAAAALSELEASLLDEQRRCGALLRQAVREMQAIVSRAYDVRL